MKLSWNIHPTRPTWIRLLQDMQQLYRAVKKGIHGMAVKNSEIKH